MAHSDTEEEHQAAITSTLVDVPPDDLGDPYGLDYDDDDFERQMRSVVEEYYTVRTSTLLHHD